MTARRAASHTAITLCLSAFVAGCTGAAGDAGVTEVVLSNADLDGKSDALGRRALDIAGISPDHLRGGSGAFIASIVDKTGDERGGNVTLTLGLAMLDPLPRSAVTATPTLLGKLTTTPGLLLLQFLGAPDGWALVTCPGANYFSSALEVDVPGQKLTDLDSGRSYSFAACKISASKLGAAPLPISDWTGLAGDYHYEVSQAAD